MCRPTSSVVASGVTSLTYKPTTDAANTLSTFTIQNGSPGGASSFPGAWTNDLTISISKNEVKLSGNGMGRRLDDTITLTANPTNLALVPVEPDTVEVRVADSYANLATGSNKLGRCASASWSITGRQTGIITLDPAEGSFSGQLERSHDMAAQLVMHLDSQGIAMMDRFRTEQIFWVRYLATGPNIAAGQPYTLQISFPCYASATQRSDVDDAYAGTYDLVPISVLDGSFNSFTEINLHVPTAISTAISTEGTGDSNYHHTAVDAETNAATEASYQSV